MVKFVKNDLRNFTVMRIYTSIAIEQRWFIMGKIIYIIPWAICDTDSLYIKKTENDGTAPLEIGAEYEEWIIKDVIPSPDRRSKDIYALVDVFKGYDVKEREDKVVPIISLTNSKKKVKELGFVKATDDEKAYILSKVLKVAKKTSGTRAKVRGVAGA